MKRAKQIIRNILHVGQRYFKTDMIYLAKNGFWLTLGQVSISFFAFMLTIAYANMLPKDSFGTYKYILSLGSVFGAITLTGLSTALTRAVSRDSHESLLTIFWVQLRWSLWITFFAGLGSLYYLLNENTVLATALLIIAVFSPISQAGGLYLSFLNGKRDFRRKSIYDIFYNLIPAISIFISLFFTTNPVILVFVFFISYTLAALLFFILTIKRYPDTEKGVVHPETITYAKHLSIMNLLSAGASQIDKVLIFHYLGPLQLAIYAFALSPISQLASLLRSINILSFPKFSSTSKELIQGTLPEKLARLWIPLALVVAAYCIAAPFVYKILFPEYLDAVIYSQIYALSLLLFPQEFMRTAMTAHASEKTLYTSTLSLLIIRIICLLLLVPSFGIAGAIGALLITNVLNTFVTRYLFAKM